VPTAVEWFDFFYPFYTEGTDTRWVPDDEIALAMTLAAAWRPACLPTDQQNQAQAHYAAYVIDYRARAAAAAGTTTLGTAVVAGPIVEKQEGDVRVKYATTGGSGVSSAQTQAQLTGPGTPSAAWKAMWDICVPPVLEGDRPVRRGAIMTAHG
jgi:hypothetical protein